MGSRAYELPRCGRPFDVRVLLAADLETPAGRLTAFSAHTSGDACHARAVAALVRTRTAGPLPAVVMGDFNAAPRRRPCGSSRARPASWTRSSA